MSEKCFCDLFENQHSEHFYSSIFDLLLYLSQFNILALTILIEIWMAQKLRFTDFEVFYLSLS